MREYSQQLKNLCLIISVYAIWVVLMTKFLKSNEDGPFAAIPFTIVSIYVWRKFFDKKTSEDLSEDELYGLVEKFVIEKGEVSASQLQMNWKKD